MWVKRSTFWGLNEDLRYQTSKVKHYKNYVENFAKVQQLLILKGFVPKELVDRDGDISLTMLEVYCACGCRPKMFG